jgi:hypothetical protein
MMGKKRHQNNFELTNCKKILRQLDCYNSCKVYITYDIFTWRPCKEKIKSLDLQVSESKTELRNI